MAIRAVAFDVGGVLEQVAPIGSLLGSWRVRLGLHGSAFQAAMASISLQGTVTGAQDEAEVRRQYRQALRLTADQADQFMTELWDWYCGELDTELFDWALSLRPRYRTAIVSNSGDGARREEFRRYPLAGNFDPVIYSHEVGLAKPDPRIYLLLCERLGLAPSEVAFLDDVPANIEAACELGIHGVLHRSAAESIAALSSLLDQ
jgi:epoxide hydrolase-like predicted phosphatase